MAGDHHIVPDCSLTRRVLWRTVLRRSLATQQQKLDEFDQFRFSIEPFRLSLIAVSERHRGSTGQINRAGDSPVGNPHSLGWATAEIPTRQRQQLEVRPPVRQDETSRRRQPSSPFRLSFSPALLAKDPSRIHRAR